MQQAEGGGFAGNPASLKGQPLGYQGVGGDTKQQVQNVHEARDRAEAAVAEKQAQREWDLSQRVFDASTETQKKAKEQLKPHLALEALAALLFLRMHLHSDNGLFAGLRANAAPGIHGPLK